MTSLAEGGVHSFARVPCEVIATKATPLTVVEPVIIESYDLKDSLTLEPRKHRRLVSVFLVFVKLFCFCTFPVLTRMFVMQLTKKKKINTIRLECWKCPSLLE